MAEQGSKGSKGPSHVVPGKSGNIAQTTTDGYFDGDAKVIKPTGHGGSNKGAH